MRFRVSEFAGSRRNAKSSVQYDIQLSGGIVTPSLSVKKGLSVQIVAWIVTTRVGLSHHAWAGRRSDLGKVLQIAKKSKKVRQNLRVKAYYVKKSSVFGGQMKWPAND